MADSPPPPRGDAPGPPSPGGTGWHAVGPGGTSDGPSDGPRTPRADRRDPHEAGGREQPPGGQDAGAATGSHGDDDTAPPYPGSSTSSRRERVRRAAETSRRAAAASKRAAAAAAGGTSRVTKAGASRLHRAAEAQGAGRTGLSRLIELNAASAFADALVTVALAGTLFFAVPTDEARGNVALYLALTMAPFAVVAPIIGPFLDRFSHGRRWAIGVTAAARGFLAWVAADAVLDEAVWLFPAALGVLVGQKAFAVTRAAAVPRLLPTEFTLVAANSRLQLAATIGTAAGAPLGLLLQQIGDDWPLRVAFFAYVGTTVLAILLPKQVDNSADELAAELREGGRPNTRKYRVGGTVVRALRANAALRAFSGFVIMFLAFMLREQPVAGLDGLLLLGIVAAAAWLGSTGGSLVGALTKGRAPDRTVLALLSLLIVVAVVSAIWWNLITVVVVGLAAGFSQQLGRLSLDAIVQRDVPELVRSNAFARSETLLQLAWVIGGAVGLVLPLNHSLGMGIAAGAMVLGLIATLRARPPSEPSPRPRSRPQPTSPASS